MDIELEIKIEQCIEIIKAKEVDKFDSAVLKIKQYGPHAFELLCFALKQANEFESMYLTNAVVAIGDIMIPYILKIMPALSGAAKSYVVAALGEFRHPDTVEAIKLAYQDPDSQVRQAVLQTIDRLYTGGFLKTEFDSLLHKALNDADIYVRSYATGIFGSIEDASALDRLIMMLSDAEPSVRAVAARGIGKRREPKGGEALIGLLGDPMAFVVSAACLALADLGDESHIAKIAEMLEHRSELVRVSAIKSLGRMRSKKSIPLLEKCLLDKNDQVSSLAGKVIEFLKESEGVK